MNAFGAWTPPSYSRENQKAYSARDGEIVWNFIPSFFRERKWNETIEIQIIDWYQICEIVVMFETEILQKQRIKYLALLGAKVYNVRFWKKAKTWKEIATWLILPVAYACLKD